MKKVQIVEDDRKILMSLSLRLRSAGYEVVTAQDATMAVTTAVKERPDLVILDISMPGGNGFQVAERLQSNAAMCGTPMIFITASRKPELRGKADELGAVGFFEKPYDASALLGLVAETIGYGENARAA